ncbi:MAG TPA: hypothetical protein VLT16_13660 [Candidatus Limnocylindrales bacterium]|nr:hypothetical protein [Candidatus Limnocylindrales bacterium]
MASINIKNKTLNSLLEKDGPFPFAFSQQEFQPVYSVEHVHFTFLSLRKSRIILITAYGLVTTTGWSQAHLQPYIYIQAPPDGIWDFVFVAKPPSGIVAEIISPIATTYVWNLGNYDLKGVRVHSATKTITQRITDEPKYISEIRPDYRIGQKAA